MGILGQADNTTSRNLRKGSAGQKPVKNVVERQDTISYQSLMNHHPDTIFAMDLSGDIISCNNNVEGVLGYTSTEIFGPFHKVVKEENLPEVVGFFEQAVAGQVQNYDCVAVHKNGQLVDLHVTNIPMYANGEIVGVYGIAKDITELKLTETRMKENETQFQHIYNSLELGVWSWDTRSKKVIYVSPGIEKLSGIKLSEFEKGFRNWKEIIHLDDVVDFEENQKKLRNGISCQYKYRIIDIKGEVKWVEAHTFPVLDSVGNLVRLDGLITDIHKKKLEEDRINDYAYHDFLTGLPNRRKLDQELEKLIKEKQATGEKFSLLFIDLDRFKVINDSLGHSIGDELLKQVSLRLEKHKRTNDHLARCGGAKFAIILNDFKSVQEAVHIANNIIIDMENPIAVKDYHLHVSTTIGIGIFPEDGQTVNEITANTDVALYRAKGLGRNNFTLYSPSMNIESYKLFILENDLRKAIKEEQFFLHYQPKVDTKTKVIVGAEALIRWNHPVFGVLPPNEFIPLAEETNLILDLGDWVIEAVCKQIKQWKEGGKKIVPVSVNISAKRFLKDNLVAIMGTIMEETGVEPKWLEIEITETSLLHNEERVLADINSLKAMGITISLDDFGTGYSSISYLKKYKVDYIKIDQSYINGIHTHPDDEAIIKSILFLARELNMKVVAEGVETEQQLDFLKDHECDLIQGYLFSRPVEVGEFSRLVTQGY
jgi:diguanylate cyclase (GGDEF)-like protein/PAS domain S-box-containing protein